MSPIEQLAADLKGRLALGPEAASIVQGLLRLIFGDAKGLKGFLDQFGAAGLGDQASSWIGKTDSPPLAPQGALEAFGAETIASLAVKAGVDNGVATAALAYLAPKLVGLLTPGGVIPASAPPVAAAFLAAGPQTGNMFRRVETVAPARPGRAGRGEDTAGLNRWIFPIIATLLAVAFIAHFWMNRSEPTAAPPAPSAVAPTPAPSVATAPSPAPLAPSRLTLANANGTINFSGLVGDDATRAAILDAIKKAFGEHASGAIEVAQNVAPAPWLANLSAALDQLKTPGVKVSMAGSEVGVGGSLADAEIDNTLNLLKPLFGEAFSFAHLPREAAAGAGHADFSSLHDNFTGQDLAALLNHVVLNFETGSAVIDATGKSILLQAATQINKLPPGTIVNISGYTDSTGDPAANVVLSQHRAEAVRDILIGAGVSPAGLTAKGYGSAASTSDGKSLAERRIEFSVSQH